MLGEERFLGVSSRFYHLEVVNFPTGMYKLVGHSRDSITRC